MGNAGLYLLLSFPFCMEQIIKILIHVYTDFKLSMLTHLDQSLTST